MMPTLLVYLGTIPVIAIINSNKFDIGTIIGFIICIVATILQGTADYQMHMFRKKKNHSFLQ